MATVQRKETRIIREGVNQEALARFRRLVKMALVEMEKENIETVFESYNDIIALSVDLVEMMIEARK